MLLMRLYTLLAFFEFCTYKVAADVFNVAKSYDKLICKAVDNSDNLSLEKNFSGTCPPWSYCNSSSGYCHCSTYNFILQCDDLTNGGQILNCHCLTFNKKTNTTEEGRCMYNCVKINFATPIETYHNLPRDISELNELMCGAFNRTGTLCGECKEGMYLPAYSYDMACTTCDTTVWSNICKYLLAAFVPLTIFCFFVLIFKINIPTSQLQGVVLYCQLLSSPYVVRDALIGSIYQRSNSLVKISRFFGMLYGIWNLDFFRIYSLQICFPLSQLMILSFDYFIAIYPLLLIVVTYVFIKIYDGRFKPFVTIWKPFQWFFKLFQENWDIKTSVIDAFATFMFLSNIKFLNICSDLLAPVKVYYMPYGDTYGYVPFFDTTIPYFRHEHLPYAVSALLILLLFVLLPTLVLLVYPLEFSQKCLHKLPQQWQIFLHTFVDSFQGCYKDGTEPGTRDCRWFSAMPFILRFLIFTCCMSSSAATYPFAAIVLTFTTLSLIVVNPYKKRFEWHSTQLSIYMLFLSCMSVCAIGLGFYNSNANLKIFFFALMCTFGFLQMIYVVILILHWIIIHRNFRMKIIKLWKPGISVESQDSI